MAPRPVGRANGTSAPPGAREQVGQFRGRLRPSAQDEETGRRIQGTKAMEQIDYIAKLSLTKGKAIKAPWVNDDQRAVRR